MAPHLVPEQPIFDADHGGEEAVWRALAATLPDEAALYAHVLLDDRGSEGEADLLVAWPDRGIAVVEVKGGYVTRREGQR